VTLRGLSTDEEFWESTGDCLPDRCTGTVSSTAIVVGCTSGRFPTMSTSSGERRPILPLFDSDSAEAAMSVSGRGSDFGNNWGVPTREDGLRGSESSTTGGA